MRRGKIITMLVTSDGDSRELIVLGIDDKHDMRFDWIGDKSVPDIHKSALFRTILERIESEPEWVETVK